MQKRGVVFGGSVHHVDIRFRRVVLVFHAGRGNLGVFRGLFQHGAVHVYPAEHAAQLLHGNAARAQHTRYLGDDGDNGGLHADLAVAAVHDAVYAAHEIIAHMWKRCGTGQTGEIRGRRGKRHACGINDRPRGGIGRHADGNRIETAGRLHRHKRRFFHDDGKRARPKGICKLFGGFGDLFDKRRQFLDIRDMHDERIIRRAALHFVDLCGDGGVQRIAGETVDGLRGDSDKAAAAQDLPRFFYILFVFFIQ